jgi:hypothetical protein
LLIYSVTLSAQARLRVIASSLDFPPFGTRLVDSIVMVSVYEVSALTVKKVRRTVANAAFV